MQLQIYFLNILGRVVKAVASDGGSGVGVSLPRI